MEVNLMFIKSEENNQHTSNTGDGIDDILKHWQKENKKWIIMKNSDHI